MEVAAIERSIRRPRFRRASEPPAFRLTDDDVEIVRQVARHRFVSSAGIATLVGRSIDRTNDRLLRLYHAGYVDRPRAQLDRFPSAGSGHLIYALANRGGRLLAAHDGRGVATPEWSRKNRGAHRPFIEHQTAIVEFRVASERAARERGDVRFIDQEEMIDTAPQRSCLGRNPFTLRAKLSPRGTVREIGVVPDLVFGLALADGSRRWYMVEIDRGTMPVTRSDLGQTSFERKVRVYLAAHAAKQHERQFGWKNFRVLTVTTDHQRIRSMQEALRRLRVPRSSGPSLFLFSTFDGLRASGPLAHEWHDGEGRAVCLI